jgi:hypothetical protein
MSAGTFAALYDRLGAETMVDLTVTTSFYCAVVRTLETLAIDVEPEYQAFLDVHPLPGSAGSRAAQAT